MSAPKVATVFASFYGELGWPVVPLNWPTANGCSCGRDCDAVGKHPIFARWQTKASTDPAIIKEWYERWPNANVGLLTGHAFDVLDIDSREAFDSVTGFVRDANQQIPEQTPIVLTGKGWHIYFQPTGHNRIGILPNVDWKGNGGFVVAPPSVHHSGVVYRWLPNANPGTPVAVAPSVLLARLAEQPPQSVPAINKPRNRAGRYNPSGLIHSVINAPIGNRNNRLNWAAFRMAQDHKAGNASARDIEYAINDLHDAAVSVGLGDQPSWRTIRSGLVAGMK